MIFRTALEHARKHPGLIPQFFFICLGMGGAGLYLVRLAKGPHVTWDKTNNPEPWNKLDPTYQYKERCSSPTVLCSFVDTLQVNADRKPDTHTLGSEV
ncbi:NADH dehydrogenase [ubiquinone] 1 alpha subcomplex subunit 4-like 2 isoform X1 [Corythoichthys intestinalis]|uniref:NADH dehydrogenase [ubiquinone] 1 alpha subcomplex subunit 4-like 2 isoform X1 n=1 Tax=Corythoichthys intestinalis TaxID=161448 RepID=UPI0025A59927|nr:NADH dehydrogenase [ubiquinone] 1 alpha subcomplex subunit 4-like 2 isoform X1 [Corythoichthys intestinalis]